MEVLSCSSTRLYKWFLKVITYIGINYSDNYDYRNSCESIHIALFSVLSPDTPAGSELLLVYL